MKAETGSLTKHFEMRPFTPSDTGAVLDLWDKTGILTWDTQPRITIQKKLGHSAGAFLVGVLDGRVVASVLVGYDGLRGWVYRLATMPELQRRGIGRRMMERAESWLRDQGCVKVKLQIEEQGREAVGFYQRLGYDVQPLISMSKLLSPAHDTRTEPTAKSAKCAE